MYRRRYRPQLLETAQKCHDDLQTLMDGLEQMQPFIRAVMEHAKENVLKGTISALLNLIEDASNFILTYLSDSVAGT